jgi:DNA oxidative demethylase
MSIAATNSGDLGWVTDRRGYRYQRIDPVTNAPWPALPESFRDVAIPAAAEAGYRDFDPDACLINQYAADTRLSLHQDSTEFAHHR